MEIYKRGEGANYAYGEPVGDPRSIGLVRGDSRIVAEISAGMLAEGSAENFDSMPDIWFQALSYELAFKENDLLTAFSMDYEKRWRVLFASLCLSNQLGLNIEREKLDLSGAATSLPGITKDFRPSGTYFGAKYANNAGFSWSSAVRWFIPVADGGKINVAISSPSTILAPAPDAFVELRKLMGEKVQWFSNEDETTEAGKVRVKCLFTEGHENVPFMTKAQASSVAQFIHDYRRYLVSLRSSGEEINKVQHMLLAPIGSGRGEGLLRRYEEDLLAAYGLGTRLPDGVHNEFSDIADIIIKESGNIFQMNFCYFQHTASEVQCGMSELCKVHEYDVSGTRRIVWAPIPVTKHGFRWLSMSETTPQINYSEIKFNDDMSQITSISIELSVTIGDKKESYRHIYSGYGERIYSPKITQAEKICQAGIWPNQDIDGWKKYYLNTYCQGDTQDTLKDMMIVKYEPVEADSLKAYDFSYTSDEDIGAWIHTIYVCNRMPKWLRAIGKNGNTLGYVYIKAEKATRKTGGGTFMASLDFGTSSSVTFFKRDPHKPAKKLTQINSISSGAVFINSSEANDPRRFFSIPGYNIIVPFATKLRLNSISESDIDNLNTLININILFPYRGDVVASILPSENTVEQDIKWKNTRRAKKLHSLFVEEVFQMFLLAAYLEGASALRMYCSYPTSFTSDKKDAFKRSLDIAKKNALLSVSDDAITFEFKVMSEGRAAAQCLSGKDTSLRRCIIDIGGGSSDFYYYGKDKEGALRAYDSSIQFASRDMFLPLVYHIVKNNKGEDMFTQIVKQCKDVFPSGRFEEVKQGIIEGAARYNETNLEHHSGKRFSGGFLGIFEEQVSWPLRDDPTKNVGERYAQSMSKLDWEINAGELQRFTSIIALCVASIAHTAGMIIRHSGHVGNDVHLTFAGNGSKIVDWLWFSHDKYNQWFKDFVAHICQESIKATPQDKSMNVIVSDYWDERKTEVAKGLLEPPIKHGDVGIPVVELKMNGESYRVKTSNGERLVKSTAKYNPEQFKSSQECQQSDADQADTVLISEFIRFIESYNNAVDAFSEKIIGRKDLRDYVPMKITLYDDAPTGEGLLFKKTDWRTIRWNGYIGEDFVLHGIRAGDFIEEQNLFIIGVKALYWMMLKEFDSYLQGTQSDSMDSHGDEVDAKGIWHVADDFEDEGGFEANDEFEDAGDEFEEQKDDDIGFDDEEGF
jgi:hypothetical protein